jgi:hypothetical protein
MAVLFLPATLLVAWLLAIFNVAAPGAAADPEFADNAMRWMMTLPAGGMFVVSGFMHTVLAKQTAANIGWQTNGFQYELGFVSLGIGIAGIWAAYLDQSAWFVLSIVISVFLLGAAANHIREMATDRNLNPGNTLVLAYDIALPVSLWALYFAL